MSNFEKVGLPRSAGNSRAARGPESEASPTLTSRGPRTGTTCAVPGSGPLCRNGRARSMVGAERGLLSRERETFITELGEGRKRQ